MFKKTRLIDLSVPLEHLAASEPMPAEIHYVRHDEEGLEQMQRFFGISITREYCQIEKLANLDQLPRPHGFHVSCLPVKIAKASAGWCRSVALVPDA